MINKIPSWLFFVVILVIWGGTLCLPAVFFKGEVENAGVAGDMFGAANALFSGLAFACLILALRMQREELALQREELRATREEFAAQTSIQDAHLDLLKMEKAERERLSDLQFEPYLMLRTKSKSDGHATASLINAGAAIFDLQVMDPEVSAGTCIDVALENDMILEKGGSIEVSWNVLNLPGTQSATFTVTLHYTDGLKVRKSTHLSISMVGQEPMRPIYWGH